MNVKSIIESGILTNYCLGFCSEEEKSLVEAYASNHPSIKMELDKIRFGLESYVLSNEIIPSSSVKLKVMYAIYKKMAMENKLFVPLIDQPEDTIEISGWLTAFKLPDPADDFENLYISELPSTELVTNFIVHAKTGHDTEIHEEFIEYLYVIKGSCNMNFEGVERSYKAGELIHILPGINHTAKVTSAGPMIALVQRQAC